MESLTTNLTKHVARVHTTSRMIAPLRQLLEAGCRTSEEKDRTNQTRFGMVSEILSTHPSGKKTSAARFGHFPTRRLVVQFKLLSNEY